MTSLILPSRFTRQPQQPATLDRTNPFVPGATIFPLAAGGLSMGALPGFAPQLFGTTSIKAGPYGKVFATTAAAGDYIKLGAIPAMTTIAFTALVVVKLVDLSSNPTIFESGSGLTGLGSSNNSFQFRANSNGSLGAVKDNVADLGSSTAGAVVAGRYFVAAVSYGSGFMQIAVDGKFLYEVASSQTFSSGNFSLLTKDGTASEKSAGEVALFYYAPRLMTAGEIVGLTSNPWQLFDAPARRVLVATAVATVGNAYALTADQGVYALTGNAAALRISRKANANAGAYALNGSQAALRVARRMPANVGAYAITGVTANLIKGTAPKALQVENGNYTITGRTVTLKVSRRMAAARGSYAITGFASGSPQDYSGFRATVQYHYIPRSKLTLVRFA